MALQVWLPLNGDIKNLGLAETSLSSVSSNISYTTGKIGQCLSASSNVSANLIWPDLAAKLAKGNKYSLACWVKLTNTVTSSWIIKLGSNSCGLWWAASTARWVWNENDNGKRVASTPIADDFDNWHHLVVTIDKTTPSETVLCNYVDGEPSDRPSHTFDTTSLSDPTGSTIQISPYGCMLNDLRIYDHILSTKEIKLLSQGLVAHYPLNDGVGGTNIAWNSSLTDNLTSWAKSGTWDFVTKEGFKCCHHTGAFQTTAYISPKQTFNTTTDGMLPYNGLIITMSADVLLENVVKGTTNYFLALYKSGETIDGSWKAPTILANSGHFTSTTSETLEPSKLNGKGWTHVWTTYKWGDYAWSNTNYRLLFYARDYTGDVYVKNLKIELGEKATPWIPNPNDTLYSTLGLNDGIVHDCSGYGHDGTAVGSGVSYSGETPRYMCSTDFQQSNATNGYINIGTGGKVADEITVSEWVYMDTWTGDPHPFSCTEGGGWNIENRNGKPSFPVYVNTVGYVHTLNGDISTPSWTSLSSGWHMFTGTYDGFNVKLYIDGELVASKATEKTDKLPIHYHATNPILIHSEPTATTGSGSYPACKMSDMRIYAIALSAEDIKSLYETAASIDDHGNVYGYELEEV